MVSSFRGQGIVSFPPSQLAAAISDLGSMPKWNSQLSYANIVKTLDNGAVIQHRVFRAKKCLIEVARDFVFWERIFEEEDGTIVVLASSAFAHEESAQIPSPEKCIRGEVHHSGWVLRPWELRGGVAGTSVTYIAHVDLKELPLQILELAGREQPLCINRLEAYLVQQEKEASGSAIAQVSPRTNRFATLNMSSPKISKSPPGSPRNRSPRGAKQ